MAVMSIARWRWLYQFVIFGKWLDTAQGAGAHRVFGLVELIAHLHSVLFACDSYSRIKAAEPAAYRGTLYLMSASSG
jgi:hypothetical protein